MEDDFKEYADKNPEAANMLIKTLYRACRVNYNKMVSKQKSNTTSGVRPEGGFEP